MARKRPALLVVERIGELRLCLSLAEIAENKTAIKFLKMEIEFLEELLGRIIENSN